MSMAEVAPTSDILFIMDVRTHGVISAYRKGCRCTDCRAANAAYQRDYSARNREKVNAQQSARKKNQTPEQRAARNAWYAEYMRTNAEQRKKRSQRERARRADPEYRARENEKLYINWRYDPSKRAVAYRKHLLKKKYGLTLAQFEAMLEAQEGVCAICYREQIGKNIHVDHNHVTGEVRGLLCGPCNTALGLFGDDADRMIRAAQYLIEHNQAKVST